MSAFEAAAQHGYGVELDVFLSRDEVPVISHDASLARIAGVDARIGQLTVAELARLRLDGTADGVPTLAAALAVLDSVPVMVEIKPQRVRAGRVEERTARVLEAHPGPWCVASFNPASVRWFRRNLPDAVRVLTASPSVEVRIPGMVVRRLAALRDLPSVAPHAVSYDVGGLPTAATDAWRAGGGVLVAWTAVGEAGLTRARQLADNVIFEHVLP
jgi:glycerophosphoryl diester phosphodiesterase